MRQLFLALFLCTCLLTFASAKDNSYILKGKITGLTDSKILLQGFYGDKSFRLDSVFADKSGEFTFRFASTAAPGQYRIIFSKNRFLDIIFNRENIVFETHAATVIDSMKVLASAENSVYYRYLKFRVKSQIRIDQLRRQMYTTDSTLPVFRESREEYLSLISQEESFTDILLRDYTGLLCTSFIKIDREPRPDPILSREEANRFTFSNYPAHFVFADTTLLRSNAVSAKIIAYLSVALSLSHHPDTLSMLLENASWRILAAALPSETMTKFIQQYLVNGFNKLGNKALAEKLRALPLPCCGCTHPANKGNQKQRQQKPVEKITVKSASGKSQSISLNDKNNMILLLEPGCEWNILFWEKLQQFSGGTAGSQKKLVVLMPEGNPADELPAQTEKYFITEETFNRLLNQTGHHTLPLLLYYDESTGKQAMISSWLQLVR